MTDRTARVAEELGLPEVDHVSLSSTKYEVNRVDDFAKPADELKEYDGQDSGFRRSTTAKIKKFQRSRDEQTESKQINETAFYSGYDTYGVVLPPYNLESLSKLYEISAPHYAAVNAKVANIVGLGYKFVETNKTKRVLETIADDSEKLKKTRRSLGQLRDQITDDLENMNEENSFTGTLVKVWRDYEVTGNGYIEIGRKKDGTIAFIGHVPAKTVRIRRDRDGFVQIAGFKVQFFANFGAHIDPETGNPRNVANPLGGGNPNEIIHISKYSPTSTFYGVPDIVSAMPAVAGNDFANKFNLDYFENKAVPRYAIILKGAKLGSTAEERLLSFFDTDLKGTNHRSVYIPLPGDTAENKVELKLEAIEAGIQDSSFGEYRKANLADILMAHRVPITKISVSEGASLAVAKDADKTFKEQVCGPEQSDFEKKLNRIIKELTDKLELSLNEMTLTDENTQSQIDERRRKTGVETANEQRISRGEPAIEGGDELFDMNAALKLGKETNDLTAQQLKLQEKQGNQSHELALEQAKKATASAAAAPAPGGGTATRRPTAPSAVTNRNRDSQRSAGANDSAGNARNPKGEGRSTP
jgi:PBSX family phage portal protein